MENYVNERVATYFQVNDYNCARTDLLTLAEYFKVELHEQVLAAVVGMHGAGGYRAQGLRISYEKYDGPLLRDSSLPVPHPSFCYAQSQTCHA